MTEEVQHPVEHQHEDDKHLKRSFFAWYAAFHLVVALLIFGIVAFAIFYLK